MTKGIPRQTQSIVAAGLMAILTIAVFAQARFSGPESAVRLYHYGIANREPETVKSVSLQDPGAGPARQLQAQVEELYSYGGVPQIGPVQKHGREAVVLVTYHSPRFQPVLLQFYMQKSRAKWKVDADRTWGLLSRARIPRD